MKRTPILAVCIALTVSVLLTGCGRSPATRYYMLGASSADQPEATVPGDPAQELVLHRIEAEDYLHRSQLLVRESASRLRLEEYDRWAEPLERSMERLLWRNLRGAGIGLVNPSSQSDSAALELRVYISQLDFAADGSADLVVYWRILDRQDRLLHAQESRYHAASAEVQTAHFDAQVEAMSGLIGDFAGDVATVARGLLETSRP